MQRESTLGRVLWIALLALLVAYVAADFARSPLLGQSGSAAVRPPRLTLWTTAPEGGGEAAIVARDAAADFELHGVSTAVKSLSGGSAQSIADFLVGSPRRRTTDLLVVTSATLAGLARDRRDTLVPGAAEQAALALELLRHAEPLGVLSRDRLTLAVPPGSSIDSGAELLEALRAAPWSRLFAIADDSFSRAQLAALVDRAGTGGETLFSVFDSGAVAAQAAENGSADTVLALDSALREEVRDGRMRHLDWPLDGGAAPRSWVALVASPRLGGRIAGLRERVARMIANRHWRVSLRRQGRIPVASGEISLRTLLTQGSAEADRLELLAREVESH